MTGNFDAPFYIMGAAEGIAGLCFLCQLIFSTCCTQPEGSVYTEIGISTSSQITQKRRNVSGTF